MPVFFYRILQYHYHNSNTNTNTNTDADIHRYNNNAPYNNINNINNINNKRYNLHMGIATVSIASSSLVAGILGMNVPNGLEENTHMFAYSIFGMLGLSMLFQGG